MQDHRVLIRAILLLVLSATVPAFAQKGEEEKGGEKAQPAQQRQAQPQRQQQAQHQQQAQPQRQPQAQSQRPVTPQRAQTQQPPRGQRQAPAYNSGNNSNRGGGQYGRISNANYSSHFGHDHHFQMGHPQFVGGYNRFQYGGYWFGYNQAWPAGWGYNDNVYVVYEGGGYYLYNLMHPGIHLSLNIF